LSAPGTDLLAAVPTADWADTQLPDLFHTIVRGDTLSQIAAHYDTSVATLAALNSLGRSYRIVAGQQLRLPAAGPVPAEPESAAEVAAVVEAAVVASVDDTVPADAAVEEMAPDALGGGESSEEPADTSAAPVQTGLLSDPSDYSVADNNSIEVQPLETLGHYADWLGIRTQRLRDINGLPFGQQVTVGQRLRLEFSDIDAPTFEGRRLAYQRHMQDRFFREHVINGVTEHIVQSGESVWVLSLRKYGVPLWLFRQYNPEVDMNLVRPGSVLSFPLLVDSDRS
jgi:membrane-bound lytic murein transglycosylase D